ncbi:MAG: peptidoglycan recognition family protein [Candidatus Thorarchaeota archaeon]|jgi:hypothetical protein
MKIPLRPSLLKVRRQSVKWVILHHTAELYDIPASRIDTAKYQMPGLFKGVLEKKQGDINYHYIIDKIKEDYIPIVARPFVYLCEWDDIDININNRAIHVALMGSYDFKIPERRLYEVLAFRVLNPFMKMFHLAPNRIKFHNQISNNKDLTCPGDFVDRAVVESMVRRFVIK